MYTELFLAVIVSIDTYLAAAAYCNSGIRIPPVSAAIINLTGAAVLGLSIKFSELLSCFISLQLLRKTGMAVMTFMGMFIIIKSLVRSAAGRISGRGGISLKMGNASLVVRLYLDDTAADVDNSKLLSAGEAAVLALVSSLDSAATGLSCGFGSIQPVVTSVLTFLFGFTAIFLGNVTGRKIASLRRDFSWIGGALLIIFAFITCKD